MVVCLLLVGVAPLKHAYDNSIYAGQRKATIHDGKCAWGIGRVALLRDRNGGSGRVALLRDRNGRKSGGLRSCAIATGRGRELERRSFRGRLRGMWDSSKRFVFFK